MNKILALSLALLMGATSPKTGTHNAPLIPTHGLTTVSGDPASCPVVAYFEVFAATDIGPNWWRFKMTYVNQTNGKKSIRVYGSGYEKIINVTGQKDVRINITSDPFKIVSATTPPMIWETYTAHDACGDLCSQQSLPMHFVSFAAQKDGSSVLLKCTVAYDDNEQPMVVERSYDGRNFKEIGKIPVNAQTNSYSFRDNGQMESPVVFYRLVGNDGTHKTYSSIVSVTFGTLKTTHLFVGGTLYLYNIPDRSKVEIYTTSGQKIAETNYKSVPLDSKPNGVYVVSVISDGKKVYSQQFLKE